MPTAFDRCKLEGHQGANANPRMKHLCSACGRPLGNASEARDLRRERFLTLEASQFVTGIGAADRQRVSDALSEFAEQRAGDGPWRDFQARDFSIDAAEEIADLRMYLLAEIRKHELRDRADEDADAELMHLRRCLAAAVEAYGAIMDYRRLRSLEP